MINGAHGQVTRFLKLNKDYITSVFYDQKHSRPIIESARTGRPDSPLGGLPEVTTRQLLKCHAAILTELHLANCLNARPEAFRSDIVLEARQSFHLPWLDSEYNAVWSIFRRVLKPIFVPIDIDVEIRPYPLFQNPELKAEYELLAFLIEYALHIPPVPDTDRITKANSLIHKEDIIPAMRFLKLLLALRFDLSQLSFSDKVLPPLAQRFAKWIDINNLLAISDNKGSFGPQPKVQELFWLDRSDILIRLNLQPDEPRTFLEHEATSTKWLNFFTAADDVVSCLGTIRRKALQVMASNPKALSETHPVVLLSTAGLPMMVAGLDGFRQAHDGVLCLENALPTLWWKILDVIVRREVFLAVCDSKVDNSKMSCPLMSARFIPYPCGSRTDDCRSLQVPSGLPIDNCIARELYERYCRSENNEHLPRDHRTLP